ncbi:hypothetical protein FSARC_12571 [Fusarium sarcochroum]|uniref:Uncharacterized protein n=1 Tax=Fusarium sarcochroum TaxID=1208366 RepID=A0A8H4T7L8_9HYPO|nr:hypothetical protein FSARC_12571 [Fusarium sarcochroum]
MGTTMVPDCDDISVTALYAMAAASNDYATAMDAVLKADGAKVKSGVHSTIDNYEKHLKEAATTMDLDKSYNDFKAAFQGLWVQSSKRIREARDMFRHQSQVYEGMINSLTSTRGLEDSQDGMTAIKQDDTDDRSVMYFWHIQTPSSTVYQLEVMKMLRSQHPQGSPLSQMV